MLYRSTEQTLIDLALTHLVGNNVGYFITVHVLLFVIILSTGTYNERKKTCLEIFLNIRFAVPRFLKRVLGNNVRMRIGIYIPR